MENLTVIVPFLNEEKFLRDSVKRLIQIDSEVKIFLFNDCSTDNSKQIAVELAKKYENIEYFENKKKVKSVANRLLKFDNIMNHSGTTCTDENQRVVININYEV